MIIENFSDLLYISSLFIPFLNNPDFLFEKLLEYKGKIIITMENRLIYSSFVQKLLEKLQIKYTFFNFTTISEIEFNDRLTAPTISLLYVLI